MDLTEIDLKGINAVTDISQCPFCLAAELSISRVEKIIIGEAPVYGSAEVPGKGEREVL
jgi:hypothetical protein